MCALSYLLFLRLLWVLLWMKPYYDASYPIVSESSEEGEECKHERVTNTVSMTTGDSLPSFLESQSIPNVLSDSEQLSHHSKSFMIALSLISRTPLFCSLVCVQYNTQKWRNTEKWGRPGNTYHVNDIRWRWGWRRGGEGVHIQQHIRHHHQALWC